MFHKQVWRDFRGTLTQQMTSRLKLFINMPMITIKLFETRLRLTNLMQPTESLCFKNLYHRVDVGLRARLPFALVYP